MLQDYSVPILMYHDVADQGPPETAPYRVSVADFREQMHFLRERGYQSIALEEWAECITAGRRPEGRRFVITFDDGFRNVIQNAWPILSEAGFRATIFVVTGRVGRTVDWDRVTGEPPALMNWSELRSLQERGNTIASHCAQHRDLTQLSDDEIAVHGDEARASLRRELGRDVAMIAYPWGKSDTRIRRVLGECGYRVGVGVDGGRSTLQEDLMLLPRIEIFGDDDLDAFALKIGADERWPAAVTARPAQTAPAPQSGKLAISAVVCTYRRYDLLTRAIDSVCGQTLDPDRYEILVIDNSPDAEVSQRVSRDYAGLHNLQWIQEQRPGLANARNAALAHVSSPIIAFIDDDAVAHPGWLDALLSAFDSGEDVAAVGGKVNPIWGAPRPAWLHDYLLGLLSVVDLGNVLRPITRDEWLVGTNVAFRVAPLKAVAGFPTHLGRRDQILLGNEELDVIEALRRNGYRVLYAPTAAVDHLVHPQRLSQTWMRRRVVWQAISDHLQNVEQHLAATQGAQHRLAALLQDDPNNGALTGPTHDSWRFAEQMEALKQLTHAMLTGFDNAGSAGAAPEEEVRFRLTTDDILRDALRHRQAAAPQTRPAAEGGGVQWASVETDDAAEDVLSRLHELPVPNHVLAPKGMLVPGEMRLLYRLTCHYYSGAGAIIDAGAFCGASAYALAAGVADNPRNLPQHRLVHSYDTFLARDEYTRMYLENNFYSRFDANGRQVERIRPVTRGESFFDLFAFQTQRYEPLIEVHHGSILESAWPGDPIEILFIDICEALEIQNHVMREFLPRLIPGRSIVIQQDFHHPWHPYIHVVMEYLDPYFEIVVSALGGSRVYRLHSPLPREILDKSMRFAFSDEETIDLLRRMVDKAPAGERRTLAAVLARQFFLLGEADRCRDVIAEVMSDLEGGGRSYFDGMFTNLCPGIHQPATNAGDAD